MTIEKKEIWLLLLIMIGSVLLRFYDANSQLWLDEISAWLNSIQRPVSQIVSEWPGVASHILFELLSHVSTSVFGFSPLSLRLPAILFGVLSIYAMYRVSRLMGDWKFALFTSALLALSYHHIYYSQNARGYTTMLCLYLLTSECVLRIVRSSGSSPRLFVAYSILGTLIAYSHPFGGIVVAGQFAFVFGHRIIVEKNLKHAWSLMTPFVAIGLMTLLLYAPFIDDIGRYASTNAADYGSAQPRIESSLFAELLHGLLSAFSGWPGLIIAMLAMAVGAVSWLVASPATIFLFGLPIGVQLLIFAAFGFGLHPRYFIIAMPGIYLAIAFAITNLLRVLPLRNRDAVRTLAYGILIIVSFVPLKNYYRYPMQDYQSAITYVEQHQAPEDLRFGVHSSGFVLTNFYGHDFPRIDTLEELQSREYGDSNVWLVVSLEPIISASTPELINHIHATYERRAEYPGTVGNGEVNIYFRAASKLP